MKVITAPERLPVYFGPLSMVFLAGSIEMGAAEEWQERIIRELASSNGFILNPRRKDWDPSWKQEIDNAEFSEQVDWELNGLELADVVVFYFDPATKSPVTMLELGLMAASDKSIIVCCPEGFWRKGNIDIVCHRHLIPQVSSLNELIASLKREVE